MVFSNQPELYLFSVQESRRLQNDRDTVKRHIVPDVENTKRWGAWRLGIGRKHALICAHIEPTDLLLSKPELLAKKISLRLRVHKHQRRQPAGTPVHKMTKPG